MFLANFVYKFPLILCSEGNASMQQYSPVFSTTFCKLLCSGGGLHVSLFITQNLHSDFLEIFRNNAASVICWLQFTAVCTFSFVESLHFINCIMMSTCSYNTPCSPIAVRLSKSICLIYFTLRNKSCSFVQGFYLNL